MYNQMNQQPPMQQHQQQSWNQQPPMNNQQQSSTSWNQQPMSNQHQQHSSHQQPPQMNQQQQQHQQPQKQVLSEQKVQELTNQFQNYDPEKKAFTSPQNFDTLLRGAGFYFNDPKVMSNLKTFFISANDFHYGEFIQVITFLTTIKESFEKLDRNRCGKINNSCMREFLKDNGYDFNDQVSYSITVVADRACTGQFDLCAAVGTILFLQFAMIHFRQADTSGDGKLQFNEIRNVIGYLGLQGCGEEVVRRFFNEADSDRSGEISPSEFIQMVIRIKFPERFNQYSK